MRIVSFLALSSALGCGASESGLQSNVTAQCVSVNQQSMVITDTTNIVTDARFNLKKVFNAIRTSTPAGVTIPSGPTPMFQEIYAAFGDCTSGGGIDPNGYGLKCRPAEESVDADDPFTTKEGALHYSPVALTNRFDLAPDNYSYCGESRIVFWKTAGPVAGRAAIITEMKTPAVIDSTTGAATCVPIANFWASLSSITDPTKAANMLEDFYFKGLPGMPFPPVSAQGAGYSDAGQVRLNSFVDDVQWNLREFKWKEVCSPTGAACSAHFVEQTTKNNPSQLLFDDQHKKAPAFQKWYLNKAVPALQAATDVNAIALGNADDYNTFESISEPEPGDPTDVRYDNDASSALRGKIQTVLDGIAGNTLSVDDILLRTTTQTCGGCHELSNNAQLGGGLVWPSSNPLGFTQIDEQSHLSPALTQQFIPHRETVLEDFLCGSGGDSPGDDTLTVGGVPVGAPN